MNYLAGLHSSRALEEQISSMQTMEPDIRIVGSLGRSVLLGNNFGNPSLEYGLRNENPLYDKYGRARDIDIINYPPDASTTPFATDSIAFNNNDVGVKKSGSDWWLYSNTRDFAEQLNPAIMQPVEGIGINDIAIRTVPLQTHIALTACRGQLRRKDDIGYSLLGLAAQRQGFLLPDSLYYPFKRLAAITIPKRIELGKYIYRRLVPTNVEIKLTPLLRKAHILPSDKNTSNLLYQNRVR